MKPWLLQTKNSILIGLLSFVLLLSLGQGASVKSASPLQNLKQTEVIHRTGSVKALNFLAQSIPQSNNLFFTRYSFSALINSHSRQASQLLKTCHHPISGDLLNAHYTHFKIAPGTEEDARFIA